MVICAGGRHWQLFLIILLCFNTFWKGNSNNEEHASEISKRFEYKYSMKYPQFFVDNKTVPFWQIGGDAFSGDDHFRLAQNLPSQKGIAFCETQVEFPEWEVVFSFNIWGKGPLGGKGLAFWYTEHKIAPGDVFGANDHWNGLGLFFDTYDPQMTRNSPYIGAIENDGTKSYSAIKDSHDAVRGACYHSVRNVYEPVYVKVTYTGHDTFMVLIDAEHRGRSYLPCFTITNLKLPKRGYFGVSAETDLHHTDDHELVTFETWQINPPKKEIPKGVHGESVKERELTESEKGHIKKAEEVSQKIMHKDEPEKLNVPAKDANEHAIINAIYAMEKTITSALSNLSTPSQQSSGGHVDNGHNQIPNEKIDEISHKITSLAQEIKKMADAVTTLVQHLPDMVSNNRESDKIQHTMQTINNKLHDLDTQTFSHSAQVVEHLQRQSSHLEAQSGSYFYVILFAMVGIQVLLSIYQAIKRRGKSEDKKFI